MTSFSLIHSSLVRWLESALGRVLAALAIPSLFLLGPNPAQSQLYCPGTSCNSSYEESPGYFGTPSGAFGGSSWDFAAGTFSAFASASAWFGLTGDDESMSTTARYTVTGLPSGTPVMVRFRVTVSGNADCCDEFCVGLSSCNSISIDGPGGLWEASNVTETQTIEMQFNGLAGDPIDVHFGLQAGAGVDGVSGAYASIGAQIDFYDVPAGGIITPCQAPPVTVEGSVKPSFGLHLLKPNPSRRAFEVSLALAGDAPGSLAIYDVAGRLIEKVDLTGYPTGRHAVRLGDREPLRAGVYLVRLVQGARVATAREVVLP